MTSPQPHTEPRPRSVALGVYALSVALAIGVVILTVAWGVPLVALVTFFLVGSLILGTARRLNWARWALTALTVTAFVFTFSLVRFQLTYNVPLSVATATQIVLEIVGCYLLFRAPAGRWYRRGRSAEGPKSQLDRPPS